MGVVDVDSMLRRMSSRQLSEWIAYAELEPFGEEREDLRSAIIAHTIYTTAGKVSKSPKKLADFMVSGMLDEPKRQTAKEMFGILTTMAGKKKKG